MYRMICHRILRQCLRAYNTVSFSGRITSDEFATAMSDTGLPLVSNNLGTQQSPAVRSDSLVGLALSGGPDSTALMLLLRDWSKAQKSQLSTFVVDHGFAFSSFPYRSLIPFADYAQKVQVKLRLSRGGLVH